MICPSGKSAGPTTPLKEIWGDHGSRAASAFPITTISDPGTNPRPPRFAVGVPDIVRRGERLVPAGQFVAGEHDARGQARLDIFLIRI
jgi:hypothetical protein